MKPAIDPENLLKLISEYSPDMLWIKDLKGRYLYANNAICKGLLIATPDEVFGKDDNFFVKRVREKHKENPEYHTFSSCSDSDEETLKAMKSLRFIEKGNIKGKLKYLEVDKAPFFDENGKLVGVIGTARDITEKILLKEKNEKLAYYDQLTTLPNRQKIILDINTNFPTACIVFNIDDFKEINDFFGTENADKILQDIANRFLDYKYIVYRIDGDEFAILFYENLSIDELKSQAQKILTLFDEEPFYVEDQTISIGFSIGIAKAKDNLLTKVDIAVNNAKNSSSDISVYEESENIEKKYKQNLEMATSIKEALLEDRIVCHYQPLIDIETGEIYSFETLIRMIDKDGSIIPPIKFLDFSKKVKLYSSITRKVIKEACETFKHRNENFSINLNIADIKDKETVKEIIKNITETDTASKVTFEILESEGIENYDEVISFINQIKALGAKIAIDDFGTGYSNFEHLLRLDVNYIKIDGSLIKNIASDEKHRIIVETIVSFARRIGIKTVAEFVADKQILEIIKEIGVSCAQGYYIGKPEKL